MFYEVVLILTRQVEVHPNQFDAFPFLPLFPGGDHVGIILFGKHHFIAGFEFEPEDDRFQGLGGVAVQGDLFFVATRQLGQVLAQRFTPLVHDAPHIITGALVAEVVMLLHRIGHHFGCRRYPAVVQVDEIGCDGIRLLHIIPEVFISCQVGWSDGSNILQRRVEVTAPGRLKQVGSECGSGQQSCFLKKRTAVVHVCCFGNTMYKFCFLQSKMIVLISGFPTIP